MSYRCQWWRGGHHWGKERPRYILGHRAKWHYYRTCRWCGKRQLRIYELFNGWRILSKTRTVRAAQQEERTNG